MLVSELDERIRRLRTALSGVPGAVLKEVEPQTYARKSMELEAAMREFYQTFYGDRVSMP
jgi:hypothetical protein